MDDSELVSALADGQLRGDEFARTVEWVGATQEARLTWHAYHVVGDVLRTGEALTSARDAAFVQRLKLALQQEVPLSDAFRAPDKEVENVPLAVSAGIQTPGGGAANSEYFNWRLLAGVASLALVSVIGWQTWSGSDEQAPAPQLAQVPRPMVIPDTTATQAVSAAGPQVMVRDPQLDALLAAHRQFGGTSALQVPTGFLRNATFEAAGR